MRGIISQDQVTFSVATSTWPRTITKEFSQEAGQLVKRGSGGTLSTGKLKRVATNGRGVEDLQDIIQGLGPDQALVLGVDHQDRKKLKIVAPDREPGEGETHRRQKYIKWPDGAKWLLLDVDQWVEPQVVLDLLAKIHPAFTKVNVLRVSSASSGLYYQGREISTKKSYHLYIPVTGDPDRFRQLLLQYFWLFGHGRVELSKAGAMLVRTLCDIAAIGRERLVFSAGALCKDGVEQRRTFEILQGKNPRSNVLDLDVVPALSPSQWMNYDVMVREAKHKLKPEADALRDKFRGEKVKEYQARGMSKRDALAVVEGALQGVCTGSMVLFFGTGADEKTVTVNQVLDNWDKYRGQYLRDPLEYDYGPNKAILRLEEDQPTVWSFAHGGRQYILKRDLAGLVAWYDGLSKKGQKRADLLARELCKSALEPAEWDTLTKKWGKKAKGLHQAIKAQRDGVLTAEMADELAEFQKKYFLIRKGTNTLVGSMEYDLEPDPETGRGFSLSQRIDFYKRDAFALMVADRFLTSVGPRGGELTVPLSKLFFMDPATRRYRKLAFIPVPLGEEGQDARPEVFNVYKGFPLLPQEGDCSLILAHIRDVICGGNEEYFDYLIKWMAHPVQNPGAKNGVAVVVQGEKGVGKSIIFDALLRRIYGPYFIKATDPAQITGRFNFHLRDKLFLLGEEAFWAGDHRAQSVVKDLITSGRMAYEEKGHTPEMGNQYLNMALLTNEEWAAKVSGADEERRWFIVRVDEGALPPAGQARRKYFDALGQQILGEGAAAFYHFLLNVNVDRHPRDVTKTDQLKEQAKLSRDSFMEWLAASAEAGRLLSKDDPAGFTAEYTWTKKKGPRLAAATIHWLYSEWCNAHRILHPITPTAMGIRLKREKAQPVVKFMKTNKANTYSFEPLTKEVRRLFDGEWEI